MILNPIRPGDLDPGKFLSQFTYYIILIGGIGGEEGGMGHNYLDYARVWNWTNVEYVIHTP